MKRVPFLLMIFCLGLIFTNCEKEEELAPELMIEDYESTDLNDEKIKRPFTGICTPVSLFPVNTWYDDTDDWRVTGQSIWVEDPECDFCGTMELTVDPKNPHDENRGKWEATWYGEITFNEDGAVIVAYVEGEGVEGKVEGLEANWIYTMTYIGELPFNPSNPTFFYVIEGNIDKPNNGQNQ